MEVRLTGRVLKSVEQTEISVKPMYHWQNGLLMKRLIRSQWLYLSSEASQRPSLMPPPPIVHLGFGPVSDMYQLAQAE